MDRSHISALHTVVHGRKAQAGKVHILRRTSSFTNPKVYISCKHTRVDKAKNVLSSPRNSVKMINKKESDGVLGQRMGGPAFTTRRS